MILPPPPPGQSEWPKTRLTKRQKVACHRESCGAVFASRVERSQDPPHPASPSREATIIIFNPGWMRSPDGVWYLTDRGRDRIRQGRAPHGRRPAPGRFAMAGFHPSRDPGLPHLLRCPDCDAIQVADPDVLGASIAVPVPIRQDHRRH